MADPRSNLFQNFSCPQFNVNATSERRQFFNAVGRVGAFDGLNRIGAAKIGEGLRTLEKISNTIRTGCGSLPTSIGSAVGSGLDAGVGWVFENVGIAKTAVDAVRSFNPQIANQALAEAENIFSKVKQGNFKLRDVPNALQNLQNLERLARNIYTPSITEQRQLVASCQPSPYAMDLIARAPKHKFMFVVQIIPNPGYESFKDLDIAFLVKDSTRPNFKYQMEEVNFYNFRSKVITRTEFEEIQMTFYDDIRNMASAFHAAYLRAMSPVTNYINWNQTSNLEDEGMNFDGGRGVGSVFTDDPVVAGGNTSQATTVPVAAQRSASLGELVENQKTIIQEIRLFHLFDGGRWMNVYKFYNPRISQLTLDGLDMTLSGDGTTVQFSFNYDAVYIATQIPFTDNDLAQAVTDASSDKGAAAYGLRFVAAASGAGGLQRPGLLPFGAAATVSNNCDTQMNTSTPPFAG